MLPKFTLYICQLLCVFLAALLLQEFGRQAEERTQRRPQIASHEADQSCSFDFSDYRSEHRSNVLCGTAYVDFPT
jgi:hypothetical protein